MTNISIASPIEPDWIGISARCCLIAAGLLAPWIALAALPFFRFGIWIDTEPTLVVYHWGSILFSLGIFFHCLREPIIKIYPVMVLIGVLILFSMMMMPFSLNMELTWYGLPQTGQGILTLIGFTFYLLGFKYLLDQGYGQFLWLNTTLAAVTISSITLIGNFSTESSNLAGWSPYIFSAFLAFIAIGLLALSLISESFIVRRWGIGMSCGLILVSSNKTAITGLLVVLGMLLIKTISPYLKKNARLGLSLLVGLVPLVTLICMGVFSSPTRFPSLWSRIHLVQMVGFDMLEHPWRLVGGWGWGSYTDAFLANLTRVSESMYQNGIWNPTWDALQRVDFHSHHQVAEALLSTGIFGALIVLLLPAIGVYTSDREKLWSAFAVFFLYTTTSSGWFEMPATLPFVALSYAAFWPNNPIWNRPFSSKFMLLLSAMAIILCFYGGMRVFTVGTTYPSTKSLITKHFSDRPPLLCHRAKDATGAGGAHIAHFLRSLANESAYYGYKDEAVVGELGESVCAAQSIKEPSLMLTVSLLTVTGDVAKAELFPWVKPLRDELLPQWRSRLEFVLKRAPYRTDLLAPYFQWRLKKQDAKGVKDWCEQILSKDPTNPVALWFKGQALKQMINQEAHAYRFFKQALKMGVSRVLPISVQLEEEIKNYFESRAVNSETPLAP